MSVTNLQTPDQLHFYLKSNKIDINDYKFFKDDDKNKYGIDGVKPLQNPFLWNHIVGKNLSEPIQFLLDYKKEWINYRIVTSILTGNPHGDSKDCLLPRTQIVALLRVLKENDKSIGVHMEDIMLSVCSASSQSTRVLHTLMAFTKNNDIPIRPNGIFIRDILTEAAKTGNMDLVELIIGFYPETLKYCGDWPYLCAIKKGLYEMAAFFISNGIDYKAKKCLGYKLILANDKKNIVLIGKNKEAHDYLVSLYEQDKKKD